MFVTLCYIMFNSSQWTRSYGVLRYLDLHEKLLFLNAFYLYYGSNYHNLDEVVEDKANAKKR